LQVLMTDMCSIWEMTMWLPSVLFRWARPFIARLMDSVAQEVKMISLASLALTRSATLFRPASRAERPSRPKKWMEDGLPNFSEK